MTAADDTGTAAARAGVRDRLGLAPDSDTVLARLDRLGPPPEPVAVPGSDLTELLTSLRVVPEDQAEIAAERPDPKRHPDRWWLLERCCHELQQTMGGTGTVNGWPAPSAAMGRYFYVWVFLAHVPALRAFNNARGIPDEVTTATMAELATQLFYHRSINGTGGLSAQQWLTTHFRGVLYRVGRLLYERQRCWFDTESGPANGDLALGVHIPRGRLTPESCDESFAAAPEFFATHFPEEQPLRWATCVSWVLDPQLRDYLNPDTNLLRFQDRFTLLDEPDPANGDQPTVEAILARSLGHSSGLPRTTSLERAIDDHLRRGGHWHFRTGWLELVRPGSEIIGDSTASGPDDDRPGCADNR